MMKKRLKQKGAVTMSAVMDVNVCVERDVKERSEALYSELGIDLTTAINVFLRQSLRVGGFPFDVRIDTPNQETIAALMEAEHILSDPSVKRYTDVEEALEALKA